MPTLTSLFKAKNKKIKENMENHVNADVLSNINGDEPLSTQEDKKDEPKEFVPNGELINVSEQSEDIKTIFKQVAIHAKDEEKQPSDYKSVGYAFSLLFMRNKAINFSGGWVMETSNVNDEEYFMSLTQKDNTGMPLFYKLKIKDENSSDSQMLNKNK